jgi:pantoate--beta-alanine ligase
LQLARTVAHLRKAGAGWRANGERIGLVPTMGALHAGHMALVAAARAACDRVVVSIFVNPKQFGPAEDLSSYPRPEATDLDMLRRAGIDLAYLPGVEEIYPPGFATLVRVAGLSEGLCGAHRAGHFDGVATVVAKLLIQVQPDIAYFGEKDYQQLTIVRRLARDLDLPVRIEGVPTVREPDGLALSSRNVYLSAEERRIAPNLARVLRAIAAALAREPGMVARELARGTAELERAGLTVEYLEIRDAETLAPVTAKITAPSRAFAAIHLGRTRLIDNLPI